MSVKLIDRNPEYWERMRYLAESVVKKHSAMIDKHSKYKDEEPILDFKVDYSEDNIYAQIERRSSSAIMTISLGFFIWLDDAAQWMNKDARFRHYLNMAKLTKDKDLSEWMMSNWISWVVSHELGHFYCGHLSSKVTKVWSEYHENDEQNTSSKFDTLSYEYDADMYASNQFFGATKIVMRSKKEIKKLGSKYFFDLGMIFGGIFHALDYLIPNPISHPMAADRMVNFINNGFISNSSDKYFSSKRNKDAMLKGACTYAFIIGDDGIEFLEKIKNYNEEAMQNARKHLLNNNFVDNRLYRFKSDWLLYKRK